MKRYSLMILQKDLVAYWSFRQNRRQSLFHKGFQVMLEREKNIKREVVVRVHFQQSVWQARRAWTNVRGRKFQREA